MRQFGLILILLVVTLTKGFSRRNTEKSDSLTTEKSYIITESQLKVINLNSALLDSLNKRFADLSFNSRRTMMTTKEISEKIFKITVQEEKTFDIILKNTKTISRGLTLKIVWLKIRNPLAMLGAFYLGYESQKIFKP